MLVHDGDTVVFARQVADALADRGAHAHLLCVPPDGAPLPALPGQADPVTGLVDLRSAPAVEPGDPSAARDIAADLAGLHDIAGRVGPHLSEAGAAGGGLVAVVAADEGPDDAECPPTAGPVAAARAAYLRAAAAEWRASRAVCVTVTAGADAAVRVADELDRLGTSAPGAPDGVVPGEEITLTERHRYRLELLPEPLVDDAQATAAWSDFPAGGVVLVIGGARGVAVPMLEALARSTRAQIVVTGRTDPDADTDPPAIRRALGEEAIRAALIAAARAEGRTPSPTEIAGEAAAVLRRRSVRDGLARLRAAGSTVTYRRVDARDDEDLARLIADVRRSHGPINGIVHAAGAVEDRRVVDKTPASLARVIDTKLRPAFALARLVPADEVAFFVLCSSVSARFANPGQADYAAANAALDRLATQWDAGRVGRVVSVGWGPWDGGMLAPVLRAAYRDRGVALIDEEVGAAAFVAELRYGDGAQTVLAADLPGLAAAGAARTGVRT